MEQLTETMKQRLLKELDKHTKLVRNVNDLPTEAPIQMAYLRTAEPVAVVRMPEYKGVLEVFIP